LWPENYHLDFCNNIGTQQTVKPAAGTSAYWRAVDKKWKACGPTGEHLNAVGIGYLSDACPQVLTRRILVIKMESDECQCRTRTSFTVLPIDRPRPYVCYKPRSISQ
jgi:hypothetical protein